MGASNSGKSGNSMLPILGMGANFLQKYNIYNNRKKITVQTVVSPL
jgi:hypothetical protein